MSPGPSRPPRLGNLLDVEEVRRLVLSQPAVIRGIQCCRLDADDILQEACLRIVAAQASPRSRWNPTRGLSWSSYVHLVGGAGARNAIRRARRWLPEVPTVQSPDRTVGPDQGGEAALDGMLALLDLDEERAMAVHLVEGRTLTEIRRAMGLSEEHASELRARVRALLLVLREG